MQTSFSSSWYHDSTRPFNPEDAAEQAGSRSDHDSFGDFSQRANDAYHETSNLQPSGIRARGSEYLFMSPQRKREPPQSPSQDRWVNAPGVVDPWSPQNLRNLGSEFRRNPSLTPGSAAVPSQYGQNVPSSQSDTPYEYHHPRPMVFYPHASYPVDYPKDNYVYTENERFDMSMEPYRGAHPSHEALGSVEIRQTQAHLSVMDSIEYPIMDIGLQDPTRFAHTFAASPSSMHTATNPASAACPVRQPDEPLISQQPPPFRVQVFDAKTMQPHHGDRRTRVVVDRGQVKKMRQLGACDECRRKKIRCSPGHPRRSSTASSPVKSSSLGVSPSDTIYSAQFTEEMSPDETIWTPSTDSNEEDEDLEMSGLETWQPENVWVYPYQ